MIGPTHIARAYVQAGKLNGRAYYRSPDGEVLYYYPEEDYWVVSVKLGGLSAKAYAPAAAMENPIDATEWYVYADGVFAKEPMARVVKAGADAVKRASGVTEERAEKRTAGAAFGGATMKDGPVGVVPKDGSGTFSPFGRRPPEGPVGVKPKDGSAFSPFGPVEVKDGPVGVVPKDGSGEFSPFGKRPPDGPVGVKPKDGSKFSPFGPVDVKEGPVGVKPKDGSTFSPFGPATVKEGPVGVVPKDGSGTFSPFGRRPPDGPVGVRPKDGSAFS